MLCQHEGVFAWTDHHVGCLNAGVVQTFFVAETRWGTPGHVLVVLSPLHEDSTLSNGESSVTKAFLGGGPKQ